MFEMVSHLSCVSGLLLYFGLKQTQFKSQSNPPPPVRLDIWFSVFMLHKLCCNRSRVVMLGLESESDLSSGCYSALFYSYSA